MIKPSKPMNTYRHLILDIDGTLLNDRGELGSGLSHAIGYLRKNSIDVVFCSGRMFGSTRKLVETHFGRGFPIISYNGGMIHLHSDDYEPVFHQPLSIEDTIEVMKRLESIHVHFQIYLDDHIYVCAENEWIQDYAQHADMAYEMVRDFELLMKDKQSGPTKMLAIAPFETLESIKLKIRDILSDKAEIFNSFRNYVDIVPKGVNKGIAIRELARIQGWNLNDCVMIGDSENDMEGFAVVGLGIAMGNATAHLKERADFVVSDNNHNGALAAIHLCFDALLDAIPAPG